MSLAAPATTRYRPEEILVAKTFTIAGNNFRYWDQWRRIPPHWIKFVAFATEQTHDARIRVTADAEPNVYDEHADACLPLSQSQVADVFAHRLMLIHVANQSGDEMGDFQFRYRYLVDDWTIAEKIRRGVLKVEKRDVAELVPTGKWTSEELRLAKKFNLIENVFAGRLPYAGETFPGLPYNRDSKLNKRTVIRIQEVARCINAIAPGGIVDVGPRITVPEGEKVILFEIACDHADAGHQTWIIVDRDIDQPGYMRLLTHCWPVNGINFPDNCWVPTVEEIYIHVASGSGETDFKVRYKYLRAKLSLIDKIKWNLDMEPSEVAVCDKLDLWDRVVAGMV